MTALVVVMTAGGGEERRPSAGGGELVAVDATTGRIERRLPGGRTPAAAAEARDGWLWVVDADARTLLAVDPASGDTETLATGATPTVRRGQMRRHARGYAANRDVVGVIGTLNSPCAVAALPELNRARGGPLAMARR